MLLSWPNILSPTWEHNFFNFIISSNLCCFYDPISRLNIDLNRSSLGCANQPWMMAFSLRMFDFDCLLIFWGANWSLVLLLGLNVNLELSKLWITFEMMDLHSFQLLEHFDMYFRLATPFHQQGGALASTSNTLVLHNLLDVRMGLVEIYDLMYLVSPWPRARPFSMVWMVYLDAYEWWKYFTLMRFGSSSVDPCKILVINLRFNNFGP